MNTFSILPALELELQGLAKGILFICFKMRISFCAFTIFFLCSVVDHFASGTGSRILCCDSSILMVKEISKHLKDYQGDINVNACNEDVRVCAQMALGGDNKWNDEPLSEGCKWNKEKWSCKFRNEDSNTIYSSERLASS